MVARLINSQVEPLVGEDATIWRIVTSHVSGGCALVRSAPVLRVCHREIIVFPLRP